MILVQACQPNAKPDSAELLNVDREFSALSLQKGMNHAFAEYCAESGVILRNNSYPIIGRNNVISRLNQQSDTTFRLTWEPMFADMALAGDMGYTYGTYLVSSMQGDSLGVGTYVSIWKRNQEGEWKFVFDAGNEGL
ncbi:MAG: hypothetical protein ABJF11_15540 [Reichenbachiella sp.]|uniref:YybH family protein n=1 Tax=Reichenbachiella sp. TaxID=2184521 RepID=UPI003266C96A